MTPPEVRVRGHHDDIRDAYSAADVAERYIEKRFASAWGSVLHETQTAVLNEVIRTHRVKRVLEIAPGPARLSRDVVGFAQGYLCDVNGGMLRVARTRLATIAARGQPVAADRSWGLVQGDAFNLPFRAGFDLVYTFRFVRHFEERERSALYAQIRSLLWEGGLFVLDAVNEAVSAALRRRQPPDAHPIPDVLYRRQELLDELRAHGFSVLQLKDVMRHMALQQRVQALVAPRAHGLAKRLIRMLEHVPGAPLEWIVVCRRSG